MSDHTQAERELLEAATALLEYLDDHDWSGIPEGGTADRLRAAISARRSIPQGEETAKAAAQGDELPPLPSNVAHVTRRIRRCEGEAAAQVVLEHFAREYGASCRAGVKGAAEIYREALEHAAFYVRDHLKDGEEHFDIIASMKIPPSYEAGEKADARDVARFDPVELGNTIYQAARSTGYVTHRQSFEITEAILLALSAQKGGEDEGKGEGK